MLFRSLTYHNARAQRFKLLAVGLPGYDELQEGLAVLAEYLAGGLSRARLRMLAARVVAVGDLVEGATFVDAFRGLTASGFGGQEAFTVVARVFRGGGLTKDAIYLRGLVSVLEYLREGGELELLFVGKIAAHHVPIARELRSRGVLEPPPALPRYLDDDAARARLQRARGEIGLLELTEGA